MRFVKPDWNNSILNLSASLAAYLGGGEKNTLPELDRALQSGYKNVVFLILDGMGVYPMSCLEEGSFLRRNTVKTLTSVFPSTTANATTTLRTALSPMEHGWFGWSLYFEEEKRCVDLFPCVDSFTGEALGKDFTERHLPTPSYYLRGKSDCEANVVVPPYWEGNEENKYIWREFSGLADAVEEICEKRGKQFVYAYCDLPDSVMHRYGVTSPEAREEIDALNRGAERLAGRLKDTLLIVTADHGQIDVGGEIELYRDEEILSFLTAPPYLEARATAFRVKHGREGEFCAAFRRKYGGEFALFDSSALIRENYFGLPANGHAALLGDFIAVGKGNTIMRLTPRSHPFKGHHTSLTEEEMLVPLILAPCGK